MSWPQNPQQPQQPEQPQSPPSPPQGGFGPPPAWGPDGAAHAQPTVVSQPAVPAPPGPPGAVPPPPGAVPPPPGGAPYGAPGPGGPGVPPAPYGMPAPAPAPGAPAPSGKKKTLLAVVGGVVALAVIGGAAVFLLKDDGDDKQDRSKGKGSASQAPVAPAQPEGNASPSPSGAQPMVAGWQTQGREEHFFQYDVPAASDKWKVFPTDTAIAYTENGKPVVVMTGAANYKEGGCSSQPNPDSVGEAGKGQLATVGTTGGGKDGDLKENARNWAGNWGFMAYGGKDHKPKIEVTDQAWNRNGIQGWTATAKVTVTNRPSPCVPPTAIVKSIAQKMPDGTFHGWVLYADQGVPDALTEAQIDKIMSTVRPLKAAPGA
ncbi:MULTISPECIES: hypothetical protein [Streptomyces]|uniref:DUF8017 domain-containing protein n=1 Tax=Streptomyces luteosporeus TaxID=173856 RepID=A0ABN3TRR7_9ACTN